jgi:hypothetical protein
MGSLPFLFWINESDDKKNNTLMNRCVEGRVVFLSSQGKISDLTRHGPQWNVPYGGFHRTPEPSACFSHAQGLLPCCPSDKLSRAGDSTWLPSIHKINTRYPIHNLTPTPLLEHQKEDARLLLCPGIVEFYFYGDRKRSPLKKIGNFVNKWPTSC